MRFSVTTIEPAHHSDSRAPMPSAQNPARRRRRPTQARSRQTVGAILEAAARLFDRGSATTNAIARLAGVSIGSLYEYFPNKDAILESLIERHVAEAEAELRAALERLPPDTPLRDGVRRLVQVVLQQHTDRPGLHRRFVEGLMGRPSIRRTIVAAERRLRQAIVPWLETHPEVRVPHVEHATRVVAEGTNALVHRYIEDPEGLAPAAFVDALTRLWVGYLRGSAHDTEPR